ncbi:DUF4864 domain-containing protein [Psychromarinibacter sp. C21-152]|uniref:DUF4864 domain-containing protein n=1 Tax=Psychromarinibacter sediminicola TaxID=3033385 RepID=A0AAE3NWF0_9RHOB|nr:DUF4864 domain-containing protein [Psychromarinibacter sediminicola]MDF0603501.1 DUF4864 domain-containing protein [Psychromarinibacter sediminicola]
MRSAVFGAVLALGLAGSVAAQEGDIQAVIDSQLEAFLAGDVAAAWSHASPAIKEIFRTPENFGRMVREGYPMVWRPAEVRYLDLESRAGQMVQRVLIADQSGALFTLEYFMVETENGWQINAVNVLKAPAPAV